MNCPTEPLATAGKKRCTGAPIERFEGVALLAGDSGIVNATLLVAVARNAAGDDKVPAGA